MFPLFMAAAEEVRRRPIRALDETLINQIAAGEVIERPSSVVKELVENSLDAGATRIEVLLKDGGKEEITILDDGHGIAPEELGLAIQRHTTSKLGEVTDLEKLSTYGFRGEALASLVSVAEVELRSRTRDADEARTVTIRYGALQGEPRPAAGAVGTAVTVRQLFAELPARWKYLRSGSTEFSHAADMVRQLALGAPQAKFFLRHNGRAVHEYVNENRAERFREVFRPSWEPLTLKESVEDMELEVFLSPPSVIQSRGELSLFINGRSVRNRGLLSAVRNAYLDTLGPQHDPSGAVYLDIRPDWVDANVHPQKLEVRCLRQERIYQWLRASLRKAIAQSTSVREVRTEPRASFAAPAPSASPVPEYRSQPVLADDFLNVDTLLAEKAAVSAPPVESPKGSVTNQAAAPASVQPPRLKYLGQVKAAYLICEDASGIVIVDQHALHEKMEFERLRAAHRTGATTVQRLLVPKVIKLDGGLESMAGEHADLLAELGFELESFGGTDVAVKARPTLIPESRLEEVLRAVLEAFREAPSSSPDVVERALHKTLATIACHSVVRAGQALSPREAETLLAGLTRLEEGWTCPHGRPVLLRLGFPAIEKHFERV
jgi:DNA mismatch repair protein MutL